MFIYKTTNKINGKIYIGCSVFRPEEKPKYLGSGSNLKKEIEKFGISNFYREILEFDIENVSKLNEREIYWISYFDSTNPGIGYNILKGGQYLNHREVVKEACNHPSEIERKSKASKFFWEDKEYRKKVSDSNKKTWSNKDIRKKHSEKMFSIFQTEKYKNTLKNSLNNMEILKCPHCKKEMKKNHAMSKHFDNCINHSDPEKRKIAIDRYNSIIKKTKKIECPHCKKIGSVGNMNRWHFKNCNFFIP